MKTHSLVQGSPEWISHRKNFYNASDAPAMLGCSPFKTRQQLLQELHTGLTAEVDPATQRRFDEGHRFEALARPLAEAIIGDDLAPVVGSEGELSASFDGLTLMGDTGFEHKRLNADLRKLPVYGTEAELFMSSDLPKMYRVQMEQQLIVCGGERILFVATDWADDDTLIEERHCWYTSDPALRDEIMAGWRQFASDLNTFKPVEVAPAAVAAPVESLPAVSVRMDGALSIVSNLPDFGIALKAFIAKIPAKPSTDQEFADTEAACKALKKAEDALDASESAALASLSNVEEMRRLVADYKALARATRLAKEKEVTARKEQIRVEIQQEAAAKFAEHHSALNKRLGHPYMLPIVPDFAGVMRGKKTVTGLRDAVEHELARAKIEASAMADKIDANLKTLRDLAADHKFLFADTSALVFKANDDLTAIIQSRIGAHKEAEDKRAAELAERERARIRQEEADRLAREQADRTAAEQRELMAAGERERDAKTQQVAAASAPAPTPPAPSAQVVAQAPAPAAGNVVPMRAPVDDARMNITALNAKLAPVSIDSAGLHALGFDPVDQLKASKLYRASDFDRICAAIVDHINKVRQPLAA